MTRYAYKINFCIIRGVLTHELSYAPPMSMPTSKPNNTCNEGSYARYQVKLDESMTFSSFLKARNLGSSRAFVKISASWSLVDT